MILAAVLRFPTLTGGLVSAAHVNVVQAAATSFDFGSGLLTYGPLGIMVAGFMFGYIVPGPTHKRIVDENDRLRTLIDEKVWPTINDATSAMKDSNTLLREVVRALPDNRPDTRSERRDS